jgi:glycosyltransferase involved in cell wall biosynthesis
MPTAQLEGFGIPLLEAMACGKPVLATPIGAMPEIVRPFEPRWVAQGADPLRLAELIGSYLAGNLPRHTPERIRGYVMANYSPAKAYDRYSDFLRLP